MNLLILFWKYLVDIRSEARLILFWENINGKLFAMQSKFHYSVIHAISDYLLYALIIYMCEMHALSLIACPEIVFAQPQYPFSPGKKCPCPCCCKKQRACVNRRQHFTTPPLTPILRLILHFRSSFYLSSPLY